MNNESKEKLTLAMLEHSIPAFDGQVLASLLNKDEQILFTKCIPDINDSFQYELIFQRTIDSHDLKIKVIIAMDKVIIKTRRVFIKVDKKPFLRVYNTILSSRYDTAYRPEETLADRFFHNIQNKVFSKVINDYNQQEQILNNKMVITVQKKVAKSVKHNTLKDEVFYECGVNETVSTNLLFDNYLICSPNEHILELTGEQK
jgi:hypothetical protein